MRDNPEPEDVYDRFHRAATQKTLTRSQSPWKAARGYVWRSVDGRMWVGCVVNWYGVIVWRDNTGVKGYLGLVRATHRMVGAVRLMDGIGQGAHMKEFH